MECQSSFYSAAGLVQSAPGKRHLLLGRTAITMQRMTNNFFRKDRGNIQYEKSLFVAIAKLEGNVVQDFYQRELNY